MDEWTDGRKHRRTRLKGPHPSAQIIDIFYIAKNNNMCIMIYEDLLHLINVHSIKAKVIIYVYSITTGKFYK